MPTDIQQDLTDRILSLMANADTWNHFLRNAPKQAGAPINIANKRHYQGVNVLLLWATQLEKGYTSPNWATFKQIKQAGGNVRKGEKSTAVIFFKTLDVEDRDTGEAKTIPMARSFRVFNADQCDNLPASWLPEVAPVTTDTNECIAIADQFFAAQNAKHEHHATRAFYRRDTDTIHTPHIDAFNSTTGYYGTLLHELVHWTSHKDRCDRVLGKRFGDDAYAFEELVAELGAVFLSAKLGVDLEHDRDGIENHASYLAGWSKRMKDDKRAIITAASMASKAVAFLEANALANTQQEAA